MKALAPAMKLFFFMTLLTGLVYPALITGIGQGLFRDQADGSFVTNKAGQEVGSSLIAQAFGKPQYFWPRPSGVDFNPMPSGPANLGPTAKDWVSKVKDRHDHGLTRDLLFASASGLDPDISPAAAADQIQRISQTRHIDRAELEKLVDQFTERRQWHFLGEERVNVLRLNLALDAHE